MPTPPPDAGACWEMKHTQDSIPFPRRSAWWSYMASLRLRRSAPRLRSGACCRPLGLRPRSARCRRRLLSAGLALATSGSASLRRPLSPSASSSLAWGSLAPLRRGLTPARPNLARLSSHPWVLKVLHILFSRSGGGGTTGRKKRGIRFFFSKFSVPFFRPGGIHSGVRAPYVSTKLAVQVSNTYAPHSFCRKKRRPRPPASPTGGGPIPSGSLHGRQFCGTHCRSVYRPAALGFGGASLSHRLSPARPSGGGVLIFWGRERGEGARERMEGKREPGERRCV